MKLSNFLNKLFQKKKILQKNKNKKTHKKHRYKFMISEIFANDNQNLIDYLFGKN
jgi:hypothetical protein